MPIDYRDLSPTERQRLPEYIRDDQWIKSFMHRSLIGHVAHKNGNQPFITPTNFWYDEMKHRIIFHSNITGRTRSNIEKEPPVCFETSEYGRLLPSNAALEFSIQYRSVIAFGNVSIVEDPIDKENSLNNLISKYFPSFQSGKEYRPITKNELARTTVYGILISSWSGKENWPNKAIQIDEWPRLPKE